MPTDALKAPTVSDLVFNDYFGYYVDNNYRLHIKASKAPNENTKAYLRMIQYSFRIFFTISSNVLGRMSLET